MRKPKCKAARLLLWAIMALLLVGCTFPQSVDTYEPPIPAETSTDQSVSDTDVTATSAMRCLYYERELFLSAMSSPRSYESGGRLMAGMVPHHLLASDMIAGFFSLAANDPEGYDTVLLVSPSHFPENCGGDVVTSSFGWETPYGSVEAGLDVVESLAQNPVIAAVDEPAAVEADHGAAGLVPFVKYYLPDTKIAVCLLSNKLDRSRSAAIGAEIAEICAGGRVLLVASVDCSHYLSPEEAAVRDVETAEAIESMDLRRILGFSDSNVDSPQTLVAFLEAAKRQDAELQRLDHSSSAEKLPQALSNPIYQEGITTYFVCAAWT